MSKNLDRNFRFAIDRIAEANTIHFTNESQKERARGQRKFVRARQIEEIVWRTIKRNVERWALIFAILGLAASSAPWINSSWIPKAYNAYNSMLGGDYYLAAIKSLHLFIHIALLSSLSLLIGGRLGKVLYYCTRGGHLQGMKVTRNIKGVPVNFVLSFNPQPAHPDGMGGAKPLGEFFLYCATRISYLLFVFLISLLVLLWYPLPDTAPIKVGTAIQFAATFIVGGILYVILFTLPLLSIRGQLNIAKRAYQLRGDELSRKLTETIGRFQKEIDYVLSEAAENAADKCSICQLKMQIDTFEKAASIRTSFIHQINSMQTFPLTGGSWIRYAASGLSIPFVIYVTWDKIMKVASDMFGHSL
ncbi:MAG: hypothetical protein HY985_09120 [Magnetospirillum sp.]|nr:hypothetical protein [Magnetospirillum sp.]